MRRQIFEQIMIHREAGKNLNFSGSYFFSAHVFGSFLYITLHA